MEKLLGGARQHRGTAPFHVHGSLREHPGDDRGHHELHGEDREDLKAT